MSRSTAKKLAGRTAAAAKRVTSTVARKASPGSSGSTGSAPAKKSAAKKTSAAKTPAKKSPEKKTPAAKTPATKTPAKAASKATTAVKKTSVKKTPAKKAPAKKATVNKMATTKKATSSTAPATRTTARAAAKKAPARSTAKKSTAEAASSLAVKSDEQPWTTEELAEVRDELNQYADRLRHELHDAEEELAGLMRDAGDGAGNDQADVGSTTFERDHEMSLANNARDMLTQTEHALQRIDDGTYGRCESCGQPIGKNRLMAFPRATLCLTCTQREERR